MSNANAEPAAGPMAVMQMLQGAQVTGILKAGLDLNVFQKLAEGPCLDLSFGRRLPDRFELAEASPTTSLHSGAPARLVGAGSTPWGRQAAGFIRCKLETSKSLAVPGQLPPILRFQLNNCTFQALLKSAGASTDFCNARRLNLDP